MLQNLKQGSNPQKVETAIRKVVRRSSIEIILKFNKKKTACNHDIVKIIEET